MAEPAADAVSGELRRIWHELLQRTPEGGDDFFELGGGSMELVMLLLHVESRFGVSMSIDELFPGDFTFGSCARAVTAAAAPAGSDR